MIINAFRKDYFRSPELVPIALVTVNRESKFMILYL